jgi:hypothetical protein
MPTKKERDLLLNTWSASGFQYRRGILSRLEVFEVPELDIVAFDGRHRKGSVCFADATPSTQNQGSPGGICAGTARTLVNSLDIGDVVTATVTIEHDARSTLFPNRHLDSPAQKQ